MTATAHQRLLNRTSYYGDRNKLSDGLNPMHLYILINDINKSKI